MSAAIEQYRAKADCRIGGLFRHKGEVFELPAFGGAVLPAHLERISPSKDDVGAGDKGVRGKPAPIPKAAQVGKDDVGAGTPVSVADVTSVNMVTR